MDYIKELFLAQAEKLIDKNTDMSQEEMIAEVVRRIDFNSNYNPTKPSNYPTIEEVRRLNEDKFSRKLGELLKGNVPRIQTFVILTPENPQSKPPGTPEENAARCTAFEKENGNESRVRGFRKLEGVYFGRENSYFIPNVSRIEAIEMGTQYDQTSVIWGEIKTDSSGRTYADATEIYSTVQYGNPIQGKRRGEITNNIGDVKGQTNVFINVDKNQDNLYSKAYGNKFSFPFPEYPQNRHLKDVEWDNKEKGTLINQVGDKFDNFGRKIDTSKLTPEQIKRVDDLVERVIRENTSAKHRWQYRSEIDYILSDAI